MKSCACFYRPVIVAKSIDQKDMSFVSTNRVAFGAGVLSQATTTARSKGSKVLAVRASAVDSYGSSSDFVERMEKAWLISQQPRPVVCSSCNSKGTLNASGVEVQASLSLGIICSAKFLLGIPLA
ncbi:hypothetical protein ERO13_A05G061100v2 [Gossypium hirsutum]|nr:hypothetical protein ERO13_A05G061100v2 [Gossypium hirsutum]